MQGMSGNENSQNRLEGRLSDIIEKIAQDLGNSVDLIIKKNQVHADASRIVFVHGRLGGPASPSYFCSSIPFNPG